MEYPTSATRDAASDNNCSVCKFQIYGISDRRTRSETISWQKCLDFYACLTLAPDLYAVKYTINYLKLFTNWVIVGTLVAGGDHGRNCTLEGYLYDVVHIFTIVGDKKPCLDKPGQINFSIECHICNHSRDESPLSAYGQWHSTYPTNFGGASMTVQPKNEPYLTSFTPVYSSSIVPYSTVRGYPAQIDPLQTHWY